MHSYIFFCVKGHPYNEDEYCKLDYKTKCQYNYEITWMKRQFFFFYNHFIEYDEHYYNTTKKHIDAFNCSMLNVALRNFVLS